MAQMHADPAGERIIDEVFLTPRVVDEDAFGRYAAALREILIEASARSEHLRAATDEVEQAAESSRAAQISLAQRVEAASQLLGEIDKRLGAEPRAQSAPTATGIDPRVRDLELKVASLTERLEAHEQCPSEPNELSPETDEILARSEAAESRLAALIERAEEAGAELSARVIDVIDRAQAQGTEMSALIGSLGDQTERAMTLLSPNDDGSGGLLEVVARGEGMAARAQSSGDRLELLSERAEAAVCSMTTAIERGGAEDTPIGTEQPSAVADRLERLVVRAEAAAKALAGAAGGIATLAAKSSDLGVGERLSIGWPIIGNKSLLTDEHAVPAKAEDAGVPGAAPYDRQPPSMPTPIAPTSLPAPEPKPEPRHEPSPLLSRPPSPIDGQTFDDADNIIPNRDRDGSLDDFEHGI